MCASPAMMPADRNCARRLGGRPMVLSLPRISAARLLVLGALLGASLLAPGPAAAKKPRQKPTTSGTPTPPPAAGQPTKTPPSAPPQQSAPAGLDGVGDRLWHYQTGPARDALGPFLAQADANGYVATAAG